MDIIVTLKVTMDDNGRYWWDRNYGTGTNATAIRRDVREHIHNVVQQLPGIQDSEATVILKD